MYKIYTVFFVLFFLNYSASDVEIKELNNQVSILNDEKKYEESILILEDIINDKKATLYEKYNAYLQKALTYKRVFNYPEVIHNLDFASQFGLKSSRKEETEIRILVEKMFIQFDSQKFDEVEESLKIIETKNLNLLEADTHAFYLNVLAVLKFKTKDFSGAQQDLDHAIRILSKDNPKHLPLIYGKYIGLAQNLQDQKMAENAFEKGMFYAEKHNMEIYKIALYYSMNHFCLAIEDYKKAYYYERLGSELSEVYNAPYQNGKLNVLEKNILEKRNRKELSTEKNMRLFMIAISVILLILILVLYKYFRKKNQIVHQENSRMRLELERLVKESDDKEDGKLQIENFNLTERQVEIINLVKKGKTNKEIGSQLFISENTVKYHLKIIYNTLGIESRWDLKV